MSALLPVSDSRPLRFGFLLEPEFSMLAFTSAVDPLSMANESSGSSLYHWRIVSNDGAPVVSSNGLQISPDGAMAEESQFDALFVCGGIHIGNDCDRRVLDWLRGLSQLNVALGAISTGSYLLARADLLNGYRCTIHWNHMARLRQDCPGATVSSALFEIDRDRYTCAGGTAPLDMMANLIARRHGVDLAATISERCICERIRDSHDCQRIPVRSRIGAHHPKLIEVVALMEANIEEPLGPDELSRLVGMSRRQLERLFHDHLGCPPTRYYLELRLAHARQLLLQSSKAVVKVAAACGFVSAPHFSKCYHDFFGVAPRSERRRQDVAFDSAIDHLGSGRGEDGATQSQMSRARVAPSEFGRGR